MFSSLLFGNNKLEITKDKAMPLIKLTSNGLKNICEIKNLNDEIKVISIIGNGRTGKSTFLNCISSFLNKTNTQIFDVQDTDEHCTSGIDMYYFKEHNIILLDCQGLQLDDSSHDPQLLLITYLISDCIIYNQKSMLNNDIFNTLSPLASFINYLENIQSNKNKPILYFRINDVELTFNAESHLEKTLKTKKDQYQNVRDAIQNLFSKVKIGITCSIDREEKNLLTQNKYYDFISNIDNNFEKTINDIINIPINKKKYNTWFESINEFVNKINSNEKIDFNKLDVYQLLIEKEILEFKLSISSDNYMDFSVGPLQSDYENDILPKIEYRDNCLKQFKNKFKLVNNSFYDKNYNEIKEKLDKPIDKALIQIELLATNAIESIEKQFFSNCNQTILYCDLWNNYINQNKKLNVNDSKKMIYNYNDKIYEFLYKINKYYKKVVNDYNNKYNDFINEKSYLISDFVLENIKAIEYWNEKINSVIKNMEKINDYILKSNMKIFKSDSLQDFKEEIINNYILTYFNKDSQSNNFLNEFYDDNSKTFDMEIHINYSNLELRYNKNENNMIVKEYLKKTLKSLLINKFIENKNFTKVCKTKARQNNILIFNKIINVKDGFVIDPIKGNLRLYYYLNDGIYDLRKIKQSFVLREFKKWLERRFNRNFILENDKIFYALLFNSKDKSTTHLLKLYYDFRAEYDLLNDNISFIKIKN